MKFLHKINDNYWIETEKNIFLRLKACKDGFHEFNRDELLAVVNKNQELLDDSDRYVIYSSGDIFYFSGIEKKFFKKSYDKDQIVVNAKNKSIEFKYGRDSEFFERVMRDGDINSMLMAIKNYTHSDEYSLWFYNELVEKFILFSSSFGGVIKVIDNKNESSSLWGFMNSGDNFEHRNIIENFIFEEKLKECKSLNRLKIDSSIPAVLSLYSKNEDYFLNKNQATLLINVIKNKINSELFLNYTEKINKIKTIIDSYSFGGFNSFLEGLVGSVKNDFGWEASSIFLSDGGGDLKLMAVASNCEFELNRDDFCNVKYKIDNKSLTGTVFLESRPIGIYEINNDPKNSHIFDEPTLGQPSNWVGVPVCRKNKSPEGVLRVKNKINNGAIDYFNAIDIKILEGVASIVAHIKHLDDLYVEKNEKIIASLQEKVEENKNLNEFIKTFRHELKSPLTILTLATNTITRKLIAAKLVKKGQSLPSSLQKVLDDLDAVGTRLSLVTSYLTFDAYELVRAPSVRKLYAEIIAPVTSFAIDYAKKRGRILDVNVVMLSGYKVFCDLESCGMVFHMIIDNAIKYSNFNSTIHVSGRSEVKYFAVQISSFGIGIRADEEKLIFDKYYRGRDAVDQKIEGSGIGLFLAKEIMKINSGDILLIKGKNPVIFEIRFPTI